MTTLSFPKSFSLNRCLRWRQWFCNGKYSHNPWYLKSRSRHFTSIPTSPTTLLILNQLTKHLRKNRQLSIVNEAHGRYTVREVIHNSYLCCHILSTWVFLRSTTSSNPSRKTSSENYLTLDSLTLSRGVSFYTVPSPTSGRSSSPPRWTRFLITYLNGSRCFFIHREVVPFVQTMSTSVEPILQPQPQTYLV